MNPLEKQQRVLDGRAHVHVAGESKEGWVGFNPKKATWAANANSVRSRNATLGVDALPVLLSASAGLVSHV